MTEADCKALWQVLAFILYVQLVTLFLVGWLWVVRNSRGELPREH